MELLLVRHAQNDVPSPEQPVAAALLQQSALTDAGAEQASRLAEHIRALAAVETTLVATSPLQRCLRTAELIADGIQGSLEVHADLRDRDVGELEFTNVEDYRQWQLSAWDHPKAADAQSESLEMMQQRVAGWLAQVRSLKAERVIAVTHGSVIELVNSLLLRMPIENMRDSLIQCDHASYHRWFVARDVATLVQSNVGTMNSLGRHQDDYLEISRRIEAGQDASVFYVDKYYVR